MSELTGDGGGNGGAVDGGAGGGSAGGGGAAPAWLTGLPDDLRADATLSRYADVEALARGHIEARRVASSRVLLPGADAGDDAWGSFYDAIGRPKDAAEYEIPLPDGDSGEFADAFRPVAHKIGLQPQQVKGLADWWNGHQAELIATENQRSIADIDALRTELGDQYAPRLEAARALAKAAGITPEVADALDVRLGSANLVRLMMELGQRAGEHGRTDGDVTPIGGAGDPDAALTARMKDKDWRTKLASGDVGVKAEYDRLVKAATQKAMRTGA